MHNELIINLFEMIFFLSRIRMQMFVRGHVFPKGVETKVRRDNLPCTRIIIATGDDIASIRLAVEPPRPVTRIGERQREGLDFETWIGTWRKTAPAGRVSRANTVEGNVSQTGLVTRRKSRNAPLYLLIRG